MAYNDINDVVYTRGLSKFGNLTLLEFMHSIIPGQNVDVYHIPVNDRNKIEYTENFKPSNYVCTCLTSYRENLY